MTERKSFEIITTDGMRFRCDKPGHSWQYALKTGSLDILDRSVVEILREEDDEVRVAFTITDVAVAGDVTEETLLLMPTEKRLTECTRCGFKEQL